MVKKRKKIIRNLLIVPDYIIFVIVFPLCLGGLLFAIPWILKQRRIWNYSGKGNPKALILSGFTLEKVNHRGYEHFLPFRNPSIIWVGVFDPTNDQEANIKIEDDLYLIGKKIPELFKLTEKLGFVATSTLFRELIGIFKLTNYCVKNQIGVLRAYKHNYPALQAYLVSSFIKIPYIVDISGNYELVRRLTGKAFYFRALNRVPFIRVFARILTNWLLGLPLRHASRVLGRSKNNYEHAFALRTPIERLSMLRISNFNAGFNSYNPEHPPARPAEYPYLLFVGRLAKVNYPLDVIDAFNIAAPQLPEYRLVIIGDGAIKFEVERKIAHSKYRDRIVFMGACPSDTVLTWTAHASLAICPCSGSTLVEAMLCGIPVIAYDVDWHSEIVIDDYTGFLVPFANIEALAKKVIDVIRNKEAANMVGMRGRELAQIAFDKDKIMEKESMYLSQTLTNP